MELLSTPEVQTYIDSHLQSDVSKLVFSKNPFPEMDFKLILQQIEAKQKAKHKLPTYYQTPSIIYPSKISVEQTSSEQTAAFKSELIKGETIIDLTGGFGVDCLFFSKSFKEVIHCELQEDLSQIVAHNLKLLGAENIRCFAQDGLSVLRELNQQFDWIYIDPSRRSDSKGKVFLLKDCLPDVTTHWREYLKYSKHILIKNSPLYDISQALEELHFIKNFYIIALENEVKELLIEIEDQYQGPIQIHTHNLGKNTTERFSFQMNSDYQTSLELPQNYLYEPNAAIMKSQGFEALATQFSAAKLHKHSHLYTSETLIENFPGRKFKIEQVLPYNKNTAKSHLQQKKLNITTRNFPETVAQLRMKWKIKDGSDQYCFFTTDKNCQKIVVFCTKI